MVGSIFSESWYKVENLNVALIQNSYIKVQYYRGEEYYILEDKYNNQFFRIKSDTYKFLMVLNTEKTVGKIWEEYLVSNPNNIPTQDEVIQILMSLHHKNMLFVKNKIDSKQLYTRMKKKQKEEFKSKILSFMYIKIPLINPDPFLNNIKPIINILFSKVGVIVWLIAFILGIYSVIENHTRVYSQSEGLLAPNNLFILYICIFVLKLFHELAHSMVVKKYGSQVSTMGIMFLVFTPVPYMDATKSWEFRSKYKRALVGSAGMIIELFFASICAVIWANTGDGLLNSICFNIMFIGSVSSIFFNGNPLLKFDAYFILSDLLEIPNLFDKSKKEFFDLCKKYIFNIKDIQTQSQTLKESIYLNLYAILSFFYRLFVVFVIVLFVADKWFFVGMLVAILSFYVWIAKPTVSFIKYIKDDPSISTYRQDIVNKSLIIFASVVFVVFILPFPYSIKIDGIILANNYTNIYVQTDGTIQDVLVKNGSYVDANTTIAVLKNGELDYDISILKEAMQETQAYLTNAQYSSIADIKTIEEQIKLQNDKLKILNERKENLIIKASDSGIFVGIDSVYLINQHYKQGTKIGTIIPNDGFYFQAVAPQEEAFNIFAIKNIEGSIKLNGRYTQTLSVSNVSVIPFYKQDLPSAVLGWYGGGEMATSIKDNTGVKTKEGFFEIRCDVDTKDERFYHGRKGILKIDMGYKSLYDRMYNKTKQLLQKRYSI